MPQAVDDFVYKYCSYDLQNRSLHWVPDLSFYCNLYIVIQCCLGVICKFYKVTTDVMCAGCSCSGIHWLMKISESCWWPLGVHPLLTQPPSVRLRESEYLPAVWYNHLWQCHLWVCDSVCVWLCLCECVCVFIVCVCACACTYLFT